MSKSKSVYVAGATGAQGGAVVNALLERGYSVIATTRNPKSDNAQALAARGVDIRQGDYTDSTAIMNAAKGADSAFAVSTSFEVGAKAEIEQGRSLLNALHDAGVGHIVLSTVGGADKNTGIAHFDGKYEIEKHLSILDTPSTVMAPVFFMENALSPWTQPKLGEGIYTAAMPAERKLQQIAVKNIGDFAVALIARGEPVFGSRYDIAGDDLSGTEAVAQMSKASGREISYQGFPVKQLRAQSEDVADMFTWFNNVGYTSDIPALKQEFPDVAWLKFSDWLALQDWGFLKKV